jgi:hypothetical protein
MKADFLFLRRFNYVDVIGFAMTVDTANNHGWWAVPVFIFYLLCSMTGEIATGVA